MTKETNAGVTPEIRAACEAYIGRRRVIEDTLAPETSEKLAVLLGQAPPGDELPPTFHWAYFHKGIPANNIAPDMHEKTGLFLPSAPFSRRMWAAGDVTVLQPLRIGVSARRVSTVTDVSFKEGSSGHMCFVTVSHEVEQESAPCISEKQTIVYRERGSREFAPETQTETLPKAYFTHPDSMLWFYSAITHNGHRIHWDRDFCHNQEGYPDLVVQGPLMATELCEAMREGTSVPMRFKFRAQAPVFTTTPVRIVVGPKDKERIGEIQRIDAVTSMTATLALL